MRPRVVCLLLLVLALTACGAETSPSSGAGPSPSSAQRVSAGSTSPAAPGSPESITGIEWQLVGMVVAGSAVAVDDVDAVLRFNGAGGFSAQACNAAEGEVEIGDGTLVLRNASSTEMFCDGLPGQIDDALNSLSESAVSWSIESGELVLGGADGTTLRYRERASVYPETEGDVEVIAGELDGWQYRLSVSHTDGVASGLNLVSRSGAGEPWGSHGLGAPSPGESPLWSIVADPIAGQRLIAGFAPLDAARATHQLTPDAEATELTLHDIDDEQWVVFAAFVPDHSPASVIEILDASGAVIADWRRD